MLLILLALTVLIAVLDNSTVRAQVQICSPFNTPIPLIPPCPRNVSLTACNVTIYFDRDGAAIIPNSIEERVTSLIENPEGDLFCFTPAGDIDTDCDFKVKDGYPANKNSGVTCKIYKCTEDSTCHCKIGTPQVSYLIKSGDMQYDAYSFKQYSAKIYSPSITPGKTARRLLSNELVFIEYANKMVKITFSQPGTHHVYFKKDDFSVLKITQNGTMTFLVPAELYVVSGELYITIYNGETIVDQRSVYIIGHTFCRLEDCIICMDAYNNFQCLPFTMKIYIVFVTFVFTVIIGFVLYFPLKILLRILLATFAVFGACFCCCIYGKARRPRLVKLVTKKFDSCTGGITYYLLPTEEPEAPQKDVTPAVLEESEPLLKPRSNGTPADRQSVDSGGSQISTLLKTIAILCFFLPAILAKPTQLNDLLRSYGLPHDGDILNDCHDGASISGTSVTCTYINATHQNCQTSFETLATVPYSQTGMCYSMRDANNHEVIKLMIFYLNLEYICTYGEGYATGRTTVHSQSVHVCGDLSQICKSQCVNTDRSGHGKLTDPLAISYTGATVCYPSCGSLFCDCAFSLDSCVYSGYGITGSAPFYNVYRPISETFRPIYLAVTAVDHTVIDYAFLDGYTTRNLSNIVVSQIGQFNADPINLGTRSIVVDYVTGSLYLADAAPLNQPQVSTLGDIQANTVAELNMPGNHIRYNHDSIFFESFPKEAKYTARMPGTDAFIADHLRIPLPGFFGPNYFVPETGNRIVANMTHAPGTAVSIKTTSPYHWVREVKTVCPEVVFWQASGYKNSKKGCAALFNMSSSCLEGSVAIDASGVGIDLWSHSTLVTNTAVTKYIRFGTSESQNKITFKFIGSGGTKEITIEFAALEDKTVVPGNNDTVVPGTETTTGALDGFLKAFLDWLDSFFKGDLSWIGWLAIAILLILLTIGSVLIIGSGAVAVVSFAGPAIATVVPMLSTLSVAKAMGKSKEKGN